MPFISHPDVDGIVEVPEVSVQVHEKSGWSRVPIADLPKAELTRIAGERGAPIHKTATKAEIVEAIESIQAQEV